MASTVCRPERKPIAAKLSLDPRRPPRMPRRGLLIGMGHLQQRRFGKGTRPKLQADRQIDRW